MSYRTLIQPAELQALLAHPQTRTLVFDASHDLSNPEAGRRAHRAARLPGSRHLNLDEDLSGAKTGRNGRHPLPDRAQFAADMASLGVVQGTQVVTYDASGGIYASRLWWMLRWAGHEEVAVLDGGLAAWQALGLPLETGETVSTANPLNAPTTTVSSASTTLADLAPTGMATVDREMLLHNLTQPTRLVVDARSPDRFRGENETLDPVGGRIPGAVNRFYRDNLGADGRLKPAAVLRAEFEALMGGRAPSDLVMQCGSGVTACHNLLALAHAGLDGAALYPGSWSEWSAWPDAPRATGPA